MDGTLLDLLQQRAIEYGDRPLYSFFDRCLSVSKSLSFATLYKRAQAFAGVLQHERCAGQPVLLYCPHGPEFLVAFFASILAGAWPVPVTRHRAGSATGLSLLLKACGARTVITTGSRSSSLPESLNNSRLRVLSVDERGEYGRPYRRPVLSAADTAFIQYTSGSTSSPKGVVISHANVMHNAELIRRAFACTPDDVGVSWLPFHHDMGLIGHVIEPLYAGLHNYFLKPADFVARPGLWLQAMTGVGGTLSGGPDFAFALATQKTGDAQLPELSLCKWRLAYCGAEKIRPETLSNFVQRFSSCGFRQASLFPCYGLAEATLFVSGQQGVITHCVSGPATNRPSVCLGQPPAGTALLVVDPVTGHKVEDGDIGEICVASDSVAQGYYHNRAVSNEVFGRVVESGRHYCRTGDRGYLWQQRLYLLGRYKNVIKRHGRNVHAEDLEAALRLGLGPKIIGRCAAFSTADQGTDKLVVLLERSRKRKTATIAPAQQLVARAGALLNREFGLVVDDICILPPGSLPLTSSGKIRRDTCFDVYRRQTSKAMGESNEVQL